MLRLADEARRLVPSLVGMSLTQISDGVTLTYVSAPDFAGTLDGLQYVDAGPCEAATARGEHVAVEHNELLDEGRWQLFAQGSAATGVMSTLSLPIFDGSVVTGGVNSTEAGATPSPATTRPWPSCSGHGRPVPSAMRTSPSARASRAVKAPARIEDANTISTAIGVLSETHHVSFEEAESNLRQAAAEPGSPSPPSRCSSCTLLGPVDRPDSPRPNGWTSVGWVGAGWTGIAVRTRSSGAAASPQPLTALNGISTGTS